MQRIDHDRNDLRRGAQLRGEEETGGGLAQEGANSSLDSRREGKWEVSTSCDNSLTKLEPSSNRRILDSRRWSRNGGALQNDASYSSS